jgi:hypothetical protein
MGVLSLNYPMHCETIVGAVFIFKLIWMIVCGLHILHFQYLSYNNIWLYFFYTSVECLFNLWLEPNSINHTIFNCISNNLNLNSYLLFCLWMPLVNIMHFFAVFWHTLLYLSFIAWYLVCNAFCGFNFLNYLKSKSLKDKAL